MSQNTDSFEDRMSEEPLEYFREPLGQFPEHTTLTSEENRVMTEPQRFDEPENVQVRAMQTESITHLETTNLWGDPQEASIQRAAGENPAQPAAPRGGGGGSGGGGSGAGGGNPPPAGAAEGHAGGDKLFGQPPDVFTGDRTKTKEFLTQWELYYNLNHLSTLMGVPYSRCMLFLTFCKGPLMATWASTISQDLTTRARQPNVRINDGQLWIHLMDSFRQQYADTQEKERAEDVLQQGIKMRGEDLDGYIARYKNLVMEAGYNRDDPLCLRKFTDGLPHNLYKDCMRLDRPGTYEQWKESAIRRQGEYVHFKNCKEQVKGVPPCLYNPFTPHQIVQMVHRDPDAMDVDQGRARLAGAEDILYNKKYKEELERRKREEDRCVGIDTTLPKPPFKPREGYHQ